jgi:hypothetical protein
MPPRNSPDGRELAGLVLAIAGALVVLLCAFITDPTLGLATFGLFCIIGGVAAGYRAGR